MNIDILFKIAAIGILVAVLNQVSFKGRKRGNGYADGIDWSSGGAIDGSKSN